MRRLTQASLLLVVVLALHTLDHTLRQDRTLSSEIALGGLSGSLGALLTLGLVATGNRYGALAAAVIGFGNALGFFAVHVLPHWSAFSDPYSGLGLDALSWASMVGGIGAGLLLGFAGLHELRRGPGVGRAAPNPV